jgi:hypothetical protein
LISPTLDIPNQLLCHVSIAVLQVVDEAVFVGDRIAEFPSSPFELIDRWVVGALGINTELRNGFFESGSVYSYI